MATCAPDSLRLMRRVPSPSPPGSLPSVVPVLHRGKQQGDAESDVVCCAAPQAPHQRSVAVVGYDGMRSMAWIDPEHDPETRKIPQKIASKNTTP